MQPKTRLLNCNYAETKADTAKCHCALKMLSGGLTQCSLLWQGIKKHWMIGFHFPGRNKAIEQQGAKVWTEIIKKMLNYFQHDRVSVNKLLFFHLFQCWVPSNNILLSDCREGMNKSNDKWLGYLHFFSLQWPTLYYIGCATYPCFRPPWYLISFARR